MPFPRMSLGLSLPCHDRARAESGSVLCRCRSPARGLGRRGKGLLRGLTLYPSAPKVLSGDTRGFSGRTQACWRAVSDGRFRPTVDLSSSDRPVRIASSIAHPIGAPEVFCNCNRSGLVRVCRCARPRVRRRPAVSGPRGIFEPACGSWPLADAVQAGAVDQVPTVPLGQCHIRTVRHKNLQGQIERFAANMWKVRQV